MLITQTPFAQYTDVDGLPLSGGSLYFGQVGQNPRTAPVAIFWDAAGTQPAAQPVKTLGGYPVRNGSPANVYTSGAYSVSLYNPAGELVFYAPDSAAFDALLSTTTTYSRSLLSAADATSARATLSAVGLTGDETVAGVKTFSSSPVLPGNASAALQAVPKQQLDASVLGKNRLINPAFSINQRNFAGGVLAAGVYGHDRWKAGAGGCTYTMSGETVTVIAGTLQQVIEGLNVPEGGTYTLSWSGTAQARVDGSSYAASPITVTGKTAGANTNIEFSTGTVTRPQYEAGSGATAFERRLYSAELSAAQRYFEVSDSSEEIVTFAASGTAVQRSVSRFSVTKRAAPTVTPTNGGVATASVGASTKTHVNWYISSTGVGQVCFVSWTASAEL